MNGRHCLNPALSEKQTDSLLGNETKRYAESGMSQVHSIAFAAQTTHLAAASCTQPGARVGLRRRGQRQGCT
eukprot:scaffold102468_cov31-Tisochrysis_lutea.AAC.1